MPKPKRRRQLYEYNFPKGYVCTREAVRYLAISRRTFDRAVSEKKIQAYTFAVFVSPTTPRAYKMSDLVALKRRIQQVRPVP
jgi:hypothetical protein